MYAKMLQDLDNASDDSQSMHDRALNRLFSIQEATAFLMPELTAMEPETLRARISSKKGTTEAAVEAMLGAGFEIAVTAGYIRAVQKSDVMTAAFDAE